MGDKEPTIVNLIQKFVNLSIKNGGEFGHRVILAVDGMISRKNLHIKIKSNLLTSLANTNFEEVEDKLVLLASSQIFMREFIENCSYREDSEKVRMMNQCLRGLNKIIPHIKNKHEINKFYTEHTDRLFKLAHISSLKVRIQIMILIFQILKKDLFSERASRFFRVLYSLLQDPSCLHSSLTELFLELLFSALKADHSIERKCACVKRLLQNACHAESNTMIAVLIFVNKLATEENGLNQLLFNSEKVDIDEEDERLKGLDDSDSDEIEQLKNWNDPQAIEKKQAEDDKKLETGELLSNGYSLDKRDPVHAGGNVACLWELIYFSKHYHPSVSRIAKEMLTRLDSTTVSYTGNPLLDFSFASFLDRFCLKKPKVKNASMREKLIERNKMSHSKTQDPFSLQKVMETAEENVREEERFIYSYFKKKLDNLGMKKKIEERKEQQRKIQSEDPEDLIDKFADELFEGELKKTDKKAKAINKQTQQLSDDDEDMEDADLDDLDDLDSDIPEPEGDEDLEDFEEEDFDGDEDFEIDNFDEEMVEGFEDEESQDLAEDGNMVFEGGYAPKKKAAATLLKKRPREQSSGKEGHPGRGGKPARGGMTAGRGGKSGGRGGGKPARGGKGQTFKKRKSK